MSEGQTSACISRPDTDANCHQLDRANSVSEKRWQNVSDDIPECRFCSDEYEAPKNGDQQNLHRKLEALDLSEI